MTDDILKAALAHYGEDEQLTVAMEELAELIVAISHLKRGRTESYANLVEELADVEIICKTLRLVVADDARVDGMVVKKLERLFDRMGNGESVTRTSDAGSYLERLVGRTR